MTVKDEDDGGVIFTGMTGHPGIGPTDGEHSSSYPSLSVLSSWPTS